MGRLGRKPVDHTSWVDVISQTDFSQSIHNHHVIELFVLSLCFFDISVGVEAFVIGFSQISSFSMKSISYNDIKAGVFKSK